MIAVDTSALMAIVLGEPEGSACTAVLLPEPEIIISAGTLAEVLNVSARRSLKDDILQLIDDLESVVVEVTKESDQRAGEAYSRWGKGIRPAGLNYGDCFAYEVAKDHNCPLLFIGNDFSKTDIVSAI